MVVEITGLSFLAPIAMFVLVFVLVYAILKKTEIIGDSDGILITISIILALIFGIVTDVRN